MTRKPTCKASHTTSRAGRAIRAVAKNEFETAGLPWNTAPSPISVNGTRIHRHPPPKVAQLITKSRRSVDSLFIAAGSLARGPVTDDLVELPSVIVRLSGSWTFSSNESVTSDHESASVRADSPSPAGPDA